MKALLKDKIEFVSKSIFERYSKEITEIIGDNLKTDSILNGGNNEKNFNRYF